MFMGLRVHLVQLLPCRMCRGCAVPCDTEVMSFPTNDDGFSYLAIDWDTAAYVNEYQTTEDKVRFNYIRFQ